METDNITLGMEKDYTIVIVSTITDQLSKTYLWDEVMNKNVSQLPYQQQTAAGVREMKLILVIQLRF